MRTYRINIIANALSSMSKNELESKLVVSLFDLETGVKISDGDSEQFEVIDYELTEATPIVKILNGG